MNSWLLWRRARQRRSRRQLDQIVQQQRQPGHLMLGGGYGAIDQMARRLAVEYSSMPLEDTVHPSTFRRNEEEQVRSLLEEILHKRVLELVTQSKQLAAADLELYIIKLVRDFRTRVARNRGNLSLSVLREQTFAADLVADIAEDSDLRMRMASRGKLPIFEPQDLDTASNAFNEALDLLGPPPETMRTGRPPGPRLPVGVS